MRREASLTAETETVVEAEVELVDDVEVAELENLEPEIVAAEELPEIIPGLARPESPALPEDDSADKVITADSKIESAGTVVATPVETIATPE